jgi:23S rRNA (adenine2503-C2)-methyltransferase
MHHPPHHIFQQTPATLKDWCADRGMKPFRAGQVLEWVYTHGVIDPAAMTNLSAKDREILASEMTFLSGPTVAHQRATDGTQKLLIEWPDDLDGPIDPGEASIDTGARLALLDNAMPYSNTARQTECVMIPATDGSRKTACISSQVGCPVGCRFCASGLGGLDGNLSPGRIVEQVWRLARLKGVGRITNVVFMGMGEPLANFQAVVHAVRTLAADWGMGISARKITISTVGMHRAIEKLADELELPVTLALSLHAPNDALRRELIPWAEFTTIDQLLAACDKWFQKTGREITLEYILLGGVNDRPEHAEELASVANRLRANINLIRYNEVRGLPYARPETPDVHRFQEILRARGVNSHIRASRGRDIAAACGQLRHENAAR